jgi:hypothetical protein
MMLACPLTVTGMIQYLGHPSFGRLEFLMGGKKRKRKKRERRMEESGREEKEKGKNATTGKRA